MEIKGKKLEGNFRRSARLDGKAINSDNRSVELSFSSEDPYERWFGVEVLSHNPKHVRMNRITDGTHPLLLQHDETKQIGVIEKAWLDEKEKKARAIVRFAPPTNRLAEEVYQDVLAGIRSQISVGYHVHHFHKEEEMDEEGNPIEEKTVFRADDWEPFECSVVSIAADVVGAGIGKEMDIAPPEPAPEPEPEPVETKVEVITEPLTRKAIYMADKSKEEQERLEIEAKAARERAEAEARAQQDRIEMEKRQARQRIEEIYAIAERFNANELKETALKEGWAVDRFRAEVMDRMNGDQVIRPMGETETSSEGKSIGELFVSSPQYRELASKVGQRRNITLSTNNVGFDKRVFSATTESLTSIQKLPGVPGLLDQQMLNVSQVYPQAATAALTIRYIKEDAYTQAATAVAESGTKPEATLNVSEVDATVRKIAVYVKVTDEMLADHEQMRGYIDGRLAYMVRAKEDRDLLLGATGSSEIEGVFNVSGINTLAASAYTTVADAFGQAINSVRVNGFVEPDTIIVHPNDWTDLVLSKDANGQYYAGGPFTGAYGVGGYSNVGRMFGLPVIQTTFCTEGTAIVGAFRLGSQIFRRTGLTLEATNSEASDFINNRVTIRAEQRLATAYYKPKAFCEITAIA